MSALKALGRSAVQQSECLLRLRHREGHVVHVLCRVAVRRRSDGRLARIIGSHTDISDLVMARQELEHQTASLTRLARDLNQQRRIAETANDAKTAFLATVSHEVRTPLNGVIGAAQLLEAQGADAGRRAELVQIIRTSGNNLLGLIEHVLDLARIEAGAFELQTRDFNLLDCIEAAVVSSAVVVVPVMSDCPTMPCARA